MLFAPELVPHASIHRVSKFWLCTIIIVSIGVQLQTAAQRPSETWQNAFFVVGCATHAKSMHSESRAFPILKSKLNELCRREALSNKFSMWIERRNLDCRLPINDLGKSILPCARSWNRATILFIAYEGNKPRAKQTEGKQFTLLRTEITEASNQRPCWRFIARFLCSFLPFLLSEEIVFIF